MYRYVWICLDMCRYVWINLDMYEEKLLQTVIFSCWGTGPITLKMDPPRHDFQLLGVIGPEIIKIDPPMCDFQLLGTWAQKS